MDGKEKKLKEPIELFGYECGDGWLPYIQEAQDLLDDYNKEHPDEEPLEFVQVKEKWGTLNIYLNRYPNGIHDKIWEIEKKSYDTCELCGAKGAKNTNTHGWYMTLCDKCREEELKQYHERFKKQ
jgi:hypothetical protein